MATRITTDFAAEQLDIITHQLSTRPEISLEQAEDYMAQLFQLAEEFDDERCRKLVVHSWAAIQDAGNQTEQAMSLALAARDIAQTMQEQRDMALEQHEELKIAVEDNDPFHPAVRDLAEMVESEFMDTVAAEGYLSWCPGCDITEEGGIPTSHDVAELFHQIITGRYSIDAPRAIREEIAMFMASIVRRVTNG